MLQKKSGSFNADDLTLFLNYCNTELVPKDQFSHEFKDHETVTRFQLSFIGKNRNLILQSLEACNFWIKKVWDSDEDSCAIIYNYFINSELRDGLKLQPQEIDYILYRINAIRKSQ